MAVVVAPKENDPSNYPLPPPTTYTFSLPRPKFPSLNPAGAPQLVRVTHDFRLGTLNDEADSWERRFCRDIFTVGWRRWRTPLSGWDREGRVWGFWLFGFWFFITHHVSFEGLSDGGSEGYGFEIHFVRIGTSSKKRSLAFIMQVMTWCSTKPHTKYCAGI